MRSSKRMLLTCGSSPSAEWCSASCGCSATAARSASSASRNSPRPSASRPRSRWRRASSRAHRPHDLGQCRHTLCSMNAAPGVSRSRACQSGSAPPKVASHSPLFTSAGHRNSGGSPSQPSTCGVSGSSHSSQMSTQPATAPSACDSAASISHCSQAHTCSGHCTSSITRRIDARGNRHDFIVTPAADQ